MELSSAVNTKTGLGPPGLRSGSDFRAQMVSLSPTAFLTVEQAMSHPYSSNRVRGCGPSSGLRLSGEASPRQLSADKLNIDSARLRGATYGLARSKKLAFIPLSRTNAEPPDVIPQGWVELIMQRLFYDKDPKSGTDRSVRAYIHTVSSGLADLDAVVLQPQTIVGQNILPDALEPTMGAQLRSEGRSRNDCDARRS